MDNKNFLITGGAGFIGTNFVRMLTSNNPNANIVVVDLLTYAGNIRNLKELIDSKRISFVHLDITDYEGIKKIYYGKDEFFSFSECSRNLFTAKRVWLFLNARYISKIGMQSSQL